MRESLRAVFGEVTFWSVVFVFWVVWEGWVRIKCFYFKYAENCCRFWSIIGG